MKSKELLYPFFGRVTTLAIVVPKWPGRRFDYLMRKEVWDLLIWKIGIVLPLIKHVWHILKDCNQSVWTNWICKYLIKNRCFWSLRVPGDCSWSWRKILGVREYARGSIKHVVEDGQATYLWTDDWHPLGPLASPTSVDAITDSELGSAKG